HTRFDCDWSSDVCSSDLVKQLMERPLGELRLCAVLIDGTPFKDRQMMVALGIGCDGRKTVLGLREGATENATVVGALLSDLLEQIGRAAGRERAEGGEGE